MAVTAIAIAAAAVAATAGGLSASGALSPGSASTRPFTNADQALSSAAMEILSASRGTRRGYFDQLAQVLHGQIPDARIPDIQFAAESNLRRGSDEMRKTESTLATAGLARTPLGVNTRAAVGTAGAQRVSTTAADFLNSLFLQAPNASLGQAQQTGLQGQGSLADIGAQIAANQASAQGNAMFGLGSGLGGLAGLALTPRATPTTTPTWTQWSPS